jgi:hypothetical protein
VAGSRPMVLVVALVWLLGHLRPQGSHAQAGSDEQHNRECDKDVELASSSGHRVFLRRPSQREMLVMQARRRHAQVAKGP